MVVVPGEETVIVMNKRVPTAVRSLIQSQGDNTQVNGKFVWPQGITPHAPVDMRSVEHCPIDDKVTLVDGKTIGVPYPQQGWNCFPSFGNYAQRQGDNT